MKYTVDLSLMDNAATMFTFKAKLTNMDFYKAWAPILQLLRNILRPTWLQVDLAIKWAADESDGIIFIFVAVAFNASIPSFKLAGKSQFSILTKLIACCAEAHKT